MYKVKARINDVTLEANYEVTLNGTELEDFKNLSLNEQQYFLKERGQVVLTEKPNSLNFTYWLGYPEIERLPLHVSANYDYLQGHLRHGSVSMELPVEKIDEFLVLDEKEQKEWLADAGELSVDDVSVEDTGDLGNLTIR